MRASIALGVSCLAASAALAACASTQSSAAATAQEPTSLENDRDLYEARCGVCHVAYHKNDFAPEEWPGIVEVMAPRAGLSAAQRVRVLRWLQSR